MTKEDLLVTADLAYIEVKEGEVELFMKEATQILEYFSTMEKVDVSELEATTHALLKQNRLREDYVTKVNISDNLLANAPEREYRFLVIPNG